MPCYEERTGVYFDLRPDVNMLADHNRGDHAEAPRPTMCRLCKSEMKENA